MKKGNFEYLTEWIENHYDVIINEYEKENSDDHVRMIFEKYPLNNEHVNSITELFIEYLINLHVIKNYEGNKLTKKDLEYMEKLIQMGMFSLFQFSNKDSIAGGKLTELMKSIYDLANTNLSLDFLEVGIDEDKFLYYMFNN